MLHCRHSTATSASPFYLRLHFGTRQPWMMFSAPKSKSLQIANVRPITHCDQKADRHFSTNQPTTPSPPAMKNERPEFSFDPNDPLNWEPTAKQRRNMAWLGFYKSKEDVPRIVSHRVYTRYHNRLRFLLFFFLISSSTVIIFTLQFMTEILIDRQKREGPRNPYRQYEQQQLEQLRMNMASSNKPPPKP